jgi:hypothetical protein
LKTLKTKNNNFFFEGCGVIEDFPWDGILREDCADPAELLKLAKRECRRLDLHQGSEPCWSLLQDLYLIQAEMKSSLIMGPGDWHQLGLGWHQLELWKEGWMRWSSQSSEVYLKPGARASSFKMKVYTGDP